MKKLGKILLVASSVLSVGALALSIDAVNKNKEFTYSVGETNNDGFGIKRVAQGETVEKPTFTTGGEKTIISPAVAQAKTNENKSKSLRFVAAISMENDAALNEYLTGLNGKEIGFHVAYDKDTNKVDLHLRVQYAYRSISAGENTYRANGELQEGEKGIADWINACGSTYASPDGVTYNYFLVLEIDGIAEKYLANIVTVQPYIREVVNEEVQYTYASHYKKATAYERSLFFLDVNGTQRLMKDNPENKTDSSSGKIKDEYMLTNVELNEGDAVTIRDSLGIAHNTFDHCLYKITEGFTAGKTCKYDFYYKSKLNTDGKDNTYVSQHIITYHFKPKQWWYQSKAHTKLYIWSSKDSNNINKAYPGELLNSENAIKDTGGNIIDWIFDVDFDKYTHCILTRWNSDGTAYWNGKTTNIELNNSYNTITLESNDYVGNGDNYDNDGTAKWKLSVTK